ncbi:hypothetical protein MJD09_17685, partial [bacterium]|nr:hypothetical protein [bacterium]
MPCQPDPVSYPSPVDIDPDPVRETNDLTIGWISRLPSIEYVWGSTNPTVEGWPSVDQQITWRAHVKNWSHEERTAVRYNWLFDGTVVDSGVVDIAPFSYATVDYPWNWEFDRHELLFVLEPETGNENHLMIYTDAITIGFYVEKGMYDYFHEHQHVMGKGSNSFEGWAQRQVRFWNAMFANAIYPETPNGVLDRIRIDNITIVPNGTVSLYQPNRNDRTVDLQWGVPFRFNTGDINLFNRYQDHTFYPDNPFYRDRIMFHELGHARYLIDVYAFDVRHSPDAEWAQTDRGRELVSGSWIDIQEQGKHIAGSKYMPWIAASNIVFNSNERGLMQYTTTFIDRYSAMAMNRIVGHRATKGNYNGPDNLGAFMLDLPEENRLVVKDDIGNILVNADVKVFQDDVTRPAYYQKFYDNVPDLELVTDEHGQVLLGKDPFDIAVFAANNSNGEGKPTTLILRVEHRGKVGYGFLPSYLFNLE